MIFRLLQSHFFTKIRHKDKKRYEIIKLNKNLQILLAISFYLLIEQLFYAFFVRSIEDPRIPLHIASAFFSLVIFITSYNIRKNFPKYVSFKYKIYQLIPPIFGISIAVMRMNVLNPRIDSLSTFYIAIIFGMGLFFRLSIAENIFIYLYAISTTLFFGNLDMVSGISVDILSINIIAFFISIINHKRFIDEFKQKKLIEKQNNRLSKQNNEIRKINKKLEKISSTDELTQLLNRRSLEKHLNNLIKRKSAFSLLLIDIDDFKHINDSYGHDTGDKILIKLGNMISNYTRSDDICGRWGGEEFMIILPNTSETHALRFGNRFKNTVANYDFSQIDSLTISIGISVFNEEKDTNIQSIFKRADKSLYLAKSQGKNTVCIQSQIAIH